MRPAPGNIPKEEAQKIAIQALAYLAGRPEELGRFLALAGLGPANLRRAAADPAFLTGIIEFLLQDEALLLAFTAELGIPPATIGAAGRALGGQP